MTAEVATSLARLTRERPEWKPWLAVVEETFRDSDAPDWDAVVPARAQLRHHPAPLLSGAVVAVDPDTVRGLLVRLLHVASGSGTPEMATLRSVLSADLDVLTWFRASLCQDREATRDIAVSSGVDADALQAVVALLSVPFLRACYRQWGQSISPSVAEGYCPLCGAWPAFAEARGIERRRFFRCRCGSEWHARPLRCPHCGGDDHHMLVTLVPDNAGLNAVIEGCRSCLGYVKTFTRLQGCFPEMVMLDDLASVHLDIVALEHGYTRPRDAGYPLDVSVIGKHAARHSV